MRKINHLFFSFFLLLGCESEETATAHDPKLDYYVESYDIPDLGFQPQLKVTYEYNTSGKVSRYHVFTYNPDSKSFAEQRHFDFVYSDNVVRKIAGTFSNSATPYVEYVYEYSLDGKVSTIKETNTASGVNSEANFVYDDINQSTKVFYTFSNGGSFEYEFHLQNGNMVFDKTTRGSQLCSDGEYTYDNYINPFKALGYTDYLLINLSTNNRLSENINRVGCAFPTFIPESYTYQYNDRRYPTLMTTFYKSGSTIGKSQREFFYK